MNCWHCKTPLYAAGGRIFILRTLIWAARGVKGKAHCAISVVPTLAQRTRKNGARRRWLCWRAKPRAPSRELDPFDFAQGRLSGTRIISSTLPSAEALG